MKRKKKEREKHTKYRMWLMEKSVLLSAAVRSSSLSFSVGPMRENERASKRDNEREKERERLL